MREAKALAGAMLYVAVLLGGTVLLLSIMVLFGTWFGYYWNYLPLVLMFVWCGWDKYKELRGEGDEKAD